IAAAPLVPEIAPLPNTPVQPIQPPTYQPPISPPPLYGNNPNPRPAYTPPPASQPTNYNPPPVSQPVDYGYSSGNQGDISSYESNYPRKRDKVSPVSRGGLRVQTWKEFVNEKVDAHSDNIFTAIATKFYLVTGYRNTPWLRGYDGQSDSKNAKGKGFEAFDGYILPNFKGSAEEVANGLELRLNQQIQGYENTDCRVVQLTDAHIVDTASQSFLGVELFPIQRGNKPDYRRFCVISYHRVRTYLLVENYGTDLFVSWFTRFEPNPSPVVLVLCLLFAMFLTLVFIQSNNFTLIIFPLALWSANFLLVPTIMQGFGILPKKANAYLVTALVMIFVIIIFVFVIGASFYSSFSGF
ncbi:MAG: hypothetical protein IM578_16885, partial [Pseudanabaena sp. M037S2SP2A07QC]|nr:hypothetical protein [Pseudanabaena sp. M037S2SP2A07QC]